MSHNHNIIDADRHFVIDNITKTITNTSDKLVISQYDHDSERYTFEIPRYIEDHDMILCDRIEVHFTNTTRNGRQQNSDVYIVKSTDIDSDRDTVFFSWLVSRQATQIVGSLEFSITFLCFDDEGNEIYNWGTDIFDEIEVIERLNNKASVIESNPDLFEAMKQEILDSISSSDIAIDREEVEQIIADYIANNPPTPGEPGTDGTDGISPTISIEEIESGHRLIITDINGSNTIDIFNGKDGVDGTNGVDGKDGTNGVDGVSPTVTIDSIEGGSRLTITDVNGSKSIDILNGTNGIDGKDGIDGSNGTDGVSPTVSIDSIEGGSRLTITDVNGSNSINILNGIDGRDGVDGSNGIDGVSPTITVEEIDGGNRITINDVNGQKSIDVLNGKDGSNGADVESGFSPTVNVEEIEGGNRITITDVNGEKSIDVLNGIDGKDGADGYIPVKGVDYYTEAETAEIQQTIQTNILASDELRNVVAELFGQFIVIGDTEPEFGPVLWFDTNVNAAVDEAAILLVLGGEDDESEVMASIDETDYPVLNTESPVPADDGESYTITVS